MRVRTRPFQALIAIACLILIALPIASVRAQAQGPIYIVK